MLPQSVPRRVESTEQLSTTELHGFNFINTSAGATSFQIQAPITGVIDILEVGWMLAETGSVNTVHILQLAVGGSVPTTAAEMDALAQVFPNAIVVTGGPIGQWLVAGAVGSGVFRGRFRATLNSESLIMAFVNGNVGTVDGYGWVIFERLEIVETDLARRERRATGERPKTERAGVR